MSLVIKRFDVIEGASSCLSPCLKRLLIQAFAFETVKETFYSSIIVAVGSAAHTRLDAMVV